MNPPDKVGESLFQCEVAESSCRYIGPERSEHFIRGAPG